MTPYNDDNRWQMPHIEPWEPKQKPGSTRRRIIYNAVAALFIFSLVFSFVELVVLGCTHKIWHGYAIGISALVALVSGMISNVIRPE